MRFSMTLEAETKLRKMAHRALMTATDLVNAESAFVKKAQTIKTPADAVAGPNADFESMASMLFYHTAYDSPDVRDRLISGAMRDPMPPEDGPAKTRWAEIDLKKEAERLGLDKPRQKWPSPR